MTDKSDHDFTSNDFATDDLQNCFVTLLQVQADHELNKADTQGVIS